MVAKDSRFIVQLNNVQEQRKTNIIWNIFKELF